MPTVVLLILSNVFMTFAWYYHLKLKSWPLWMAIGLSWGIAFFEYCLQVPANRWGHGRFTVSQLKIMQEAITITVFLLFSIAVLREKPRWNEYAAFGLIFLAVLVAQAGKRDAPAAAGAAVSANQEGGGGQGEGP